MNFKKGITYTIETEQGDTITGTFHGESYDNSPDANEDDYLYFFTVEGEAVRTMLYAWEIVNVTEVKQN